MPKITKITGLQLCTETEKPCLCRCEPLLHSHRTCQALSQKHCTVHTEPRIRHAAQAGHMNLAYARCHPKQIIVHSRRESRRSEGGSNKWKTTQAGRTDTIPSLHPRGLRIANGRVTFAHVKSGLPLPILTVCWATRPQHVQNGT